MCVCAVVVSVFLKYELELMHGSPLIYFFHVDIVWHFDSLCIEAKSPIDSRTNNGIGTKDDKFQRKLINDANIYLTSYSTFNSTLNI